VQLAVSATRALREEGRTRADHRPYVGAALYTSTQPDIGTAGKNKVLAQCSPAVLRQRQPGRTLNLLKHSCAKVKSSKVPMSSGYFHKLPVEPDVFGNFCISYPNYAPKYGANLCALPIKQRTDQRTRKTLPNPQHSASPVRVQVC
jgi:hypothetical protein